MATNNLKTVIFMGRSGSGKGTQAKAVVATLQEATGRETFYLESGQQFRDFIAAGGYSAKLSQQIMDAGQLQPAFLAIWNWSHLLVAHLTGEEHLVIDGTPRSLDEALILDTALKFYQREPFAFVYLNVSADEARERLLLRGRGDDQTVEKINERLRWFDESVLPVVEHYRTHPQCRFIEIDGKSPIPEVAAAIKSALADYLAD